MKVLEIVSGRRRVSVPLDRIVYIERAGRQVKVICKKESYMTYGSLRDVLSRLSDNFIRCHTGYIINLDYVIAIHSKYIELVGDVRVNIGRAYEDEVRGLLE